MGHPYSRSSKFLRQMKQRDMVPDGRYLRGMQLGTVEDETDQTPDQAPRGDVPRDGQEEHREA